MKNNDIAVTPSDSTIVLKATNGSTFVANTDGSIGVHRESIPLLIRVLAEQLAEHHVASVGEQKHASAALRALRAYLGDPEEDSISRHSWL